MATKKKQPVKVNQNIDFISFSEKSKEEREYHCCSCGKKFKVQKGNFLTSKSPIFSGNNGFVPMCKKCTVLYYRQMVEYFCGDEEKALERMCQLFDWYYSDDLAQATSKVNPETARVTAYPAKLNLNNSARGTTYADTLRDRVNIASVSDPDELQFVSGVKIPKKTIKLFGLGYAADAYARLQEHYDTYIAMVVSPTNSQKNAAKNAALLQFQIEAEIKTGGKNVSTLTNSLASILNTNGFNETKMADSYTNQLDLWVRDIETYCPADYFRDKSIYQDEDKLGSYIERFLLRPMKNLFGSEKPKMDEEFNVNGDQ